MLKPGVLQVDARYPVTLPAGSEQQSLGAAAMVQGLPQRCLSALLSARGAWVEHLNAVYCALLFMGHESRKSVAFQYPFVGGCAGP